MFDTLGINLFGASPFEALGIDWVSAVFHIVNLVILVVAMFFILFKPVKKIIANQRQKLSDVFEENKKLNEEAVETKQKYETLMTEVKQEVMKISADATENAQRKTDEMVAAAEQQAANILEAARQDVIAEKKRLLVDFEDSVSKMAVEIAEKILEREVSDKDNKEIIDSCLREWDS